MAVEPDVLLLRTRSIVALVASFCVHVGLILAAVRGASAAHPPGPPDQLSADPWIGDTFELSESAEGPGVTGASTGEPAAAQGPESPAAPAAPADTAAGATASAHASRPAPAPAERPRTRRPAVHPRTASSSGASPEAKGPGVASSSAGQSGAFGMQDPGRLAPRDLSKAFTRAVPIAVSGDPVWATLPQGSAGSFELKLVLGEDGRITSATPDRGVPEHLRIIGAKTVSLLGGGTFAIRSVPGAGVQVLRISVSISRVDGPGSDDPSSAGAYGLGFEPPREGKPGEAHFTLRSGKHVTISVRLVEPK